MAKYKPTFAYLTSRLWFIFLGPSIFLFMMILGTPTDMPSAAYGVLAATIWISIWWISEAVPIPITSLLPIVLFPMVGDMSMKEVTSPYATPIIFLFIGGFILALAMEKWQLHRRIALHIIHLVGTNMRQIVLGFIMATGFLSMWISNTATTLMMLPIALSVITQFQYFNEKNQLQIQGADKFGKALVLSIAYAASIGGMATLVGTPTNLIFAQNVKEFYHVDIPFDQWFWVSLPISLILLVVCWQHIVRWAFPLSKQKIEAGKIVIQSQLQSLGKMTLEEKWVLGIFATVALAWISRRYLITPFFPKINDINIALMGAFLLFIIPSSSKKGEQLMDWKTSLKLPWGVLILFGGAFSLAAAFESSGLTQWIAARLSLLKGIPLWIILLLLVAGVNFLTEITQNMATCTLMMPILAASAKALDLHPYPLMVGTCIAASCAFMLPFATAPNAIVFGSGVFNIREMIRAGFWLNLVSIVVIVFMIYFGLPLIWGIELEGFPF